MPVKYEEQCKLMMAAKLPQLIKQLQRRQAWENIFLKIRTKEEFTKKLWLLQGVQHAQLPQKFSIIKQNIAVIEVLLMQ